MCMCICTSPKSLFCVLISMHALSRGGGRLSLTSTGHHSLPAVAVPSVLPACRETDSFTQHQMLMQCQGMQLGDRSSGNKWVRVGQLSIERWRGGGMGHMLFPKAEMASARSEAGCLFSEMF